MTRRATWVVTIAAIVLFGGVLNSYRATDAAPPNPPVPLGNEVEQRIEMIGQLKEIVSQLREQNKLLREQNDLLKSGKLKVLVDR
ncbi:MAG: hypothetical protein NTW96_14675 [Planctomycetia bacterium]|nr:hypothetical protein [Planctomycetia bacterium]